MRSPLQSFASILAWGLLAFAALIVFTMATPWRGGAESPPAECEGLDTAQCQAKLQVRTGPETGRLQEEILSMREACVDAGYLCAETGATGSLRVLRWPRETTSIRIWVPQPSGIPSTLAREFQRAAVRGIQAWQGHPIPLSIRTRMSGETPEITVQWVRRMDEDRLGRAQVEWIRRGEEVEVRVVGFTVATHEPGTPVRELSPDQVELIAAHEMGHALGLPHSDDPRDVMFPQNTATRLSTRDYRTLDALYALPNGVEIRR